MVLHEYLVANARHFPEKTAVVHGDGRWTYADLDRYSDGVAARLLEHGVRKGDRVALIARNSVAYIGAYFGIMKAAAAVVPVNTQQTEREIVEQLADCRPSVVFAEPSSIDIMARAAAALPFPFPLVVLDESFFAGAGVPAAVPCDEHDLAAIIYTSGTTGRPKGVMLTHRNLCANASAIITYLGLTDGDSVMVVLPFYYSYGNSLLTTHIMAGGTIVIDDRFLYPNKVLELMTAEKVTGFAGVPSHYAILLRKSALPGFRLPHLRYVTQAGGSMSPSMIGEFRALLPHVRFFVMYGQTEATARLSYLPPEYLEKKSGSVGRGIPGITLEIVDENGSEVVPGQTGEITARGPGVMSGYWNAPDETRRVLKNGCLYTGDLARRDDEGFIYIVGRKTDIIKSGAHRISPGEIEDVVVRMPGVLECSVIGVRDEILGEAIRLFVVPDGTMLLEKKDVMAFCRKNLAAYKLPKYVEIIQALLRTSSGKVRRDYLRNLEPAVACNR